MIARIKNGLLVGGTVAWSGDTVIIALQQWVGHLVAVVVGVAAAGRRRWIGVPVLCHVVHGRVTSCLGGGYSVSFYKDGRDLFVIGRLKVSYIGPDNVDEFLFGRIWPQGETLTHTTHLAMILFGRRIFWGFLE
uniref:Uncharacterized protein n=1 Tax=Cacopsylla melanoneura TaxID=428564 RepID=A0A8D9B5X5_9HEMI